MVSQLVEKQENKSLATEILPFTETERQVVGEVWQAYLQTVNIIARLRGLKGNVSVASDQSGFIISKG